MKKKKKEPIRSQVKLKWTSLKKRKKISILYLRQSKRFFLKFTKQKRYLLKYLKKKWTFQSPLSKLSRKLTPFNWFNLWFRFSFCTLWLKTKIKRIKPVKQVLPLKKKSKKLIRRIYTISLNPNFKRSKLIWSQITQQIRKNSVSSYLNVKKLRIRLRFHFRFKSKKKTWFKQKILRWNYIAKKKKKKLFRKNKDGTLFISHEVPTAWNQNLLKTTIGNYFVNAQIQYHYFLSKQKIVQTYQQRPTRWKIRWALIKHKLHDLQIRHKLGWYYNNITWKKKTSYSGFSHRHQPSLFLAYWKQHKIRPWLDYLQTKRRIYNGLLPLRRKEHYWLKKYVYVPYLQKKKPGRQKKNKLYQLHNRLLFPFWTRGLRNKKKIKHIQHILSKIILPFYGHLSLKQFQRLGKDIQRKKLKSLAIYNNKISMFEQRLDVCAYRLNLAPTIFWARKLIENGGIFVSSTYNLNSWEKLYGNLKNAVFPIKLRDPKNLYRKSFFKYFSFSKQIRKFFIPPLRKINYLLKPGELIYCATNSFLNQFKTNSVLWKKPIPSHFLTFSDLTEINKSWINSDNSISSFSTPENKLTTISTLLFAPTFFTLAKNDRINPSFIRWIFL